MDSALDIGEVLVRASQGVRTLSRYVGHGADVLALVALGISRELDTAWLTPVL